jgi:integrase
MRAKKAVGREELWFHDLRRSFVTKARRCGVAESVITQMSGHRTRAVFDRYSIVSEDDIREAARRIETNAQRELSEAANESNLGQDSVNRL